MAMGEPESVPPPTTGVCTDSTPVTCSSRCVATARGVGCSNTIVDESATPVSERRRDDSSVAASESTPASISGVSTSSATSSAPVSSRTTRSTADSMCAWRRDGASVARTPASSLSVPGAGAATAVLFTLSPCARSSPKRSCSGSARSCRSSRTSDRCAICTLNAMPRQRESCGARQDAYCSREMPAMPEIVSRCSAIDANAAAPMPAPPTSGHCRLHAATPCARCDRARASRHALPAA